MKLFVITTERIVEGESEAINRLFENGLETLHLRKPTATAEETRIWIEQINRDFHSRVVIHDHYHLMKAFGLRGIHLNARNREKLSCIDLTMRSFTLSRSCHSIEEITESAFCDYVFLSPVFDSISKIGYKKGFTFEQLNAAKNDRLIHERVIALGGITAETMPVAHALGFGGVAFLGALWGDFAVSRNRNELLKRFIELRNIR